MKNGGVILFLDEFGGFIARNDSFDDCRSRWILGCGGGGDGWCGIGYR